MFSVFEEHTRWIAKGKAGVPVELGVPVCVIEDQHQFILNHRVMWREEDVAVAVAFIEETNEKYPSFWLAVLTEVSGVPATKAGLMECLRAASCRRRAGRARLTGRGKRAKSLLRGAGAIPPWSRR